MLNILKILYVYPYYSGWGVNFLVNSTMHSIYVYTDIHQGLKMFANSCIIYIIFEVRIAFLDLS